MSRSKAANKLSEDSPPEHFHDLRKKGKRLPYALEPLQEVYGKPPPISAARPLARSCSPPRLSGRGIEGPDHERRVATVGRGGEGALSHAAAQLVVSC